jgi:signal transduction histidine kinase
VIDSLNRIDNDSLRIGRLIDYVYDNSARQPDAALQSIQNLMREARALRLYQVDLLGAKHTAWIYFRKSDYPQSLDRFTALIPQARRLGMHQTEVEAIKQMSIIYLRTDNIERSLRYLEIADSLAESYKLIRMRADLRSELGIRYAELGRYDAAIAYYQQAITLAQAANQNDQLLSARVNMAIALKNLKRFDEALQIYKESLADLHPTEKLEEAIIHDNIANLWFEAGQSDSALKYVQLSLKTTEKIYINTNDIRQDLQSLLVKIYEAKGDYRNALAAQKALAVLKDSIFNEQSAMQLEEAGARFESQLKDSKIESQDLQIRSRKRLNILLGVGVLLLLIIGIVFRVNQRKVQRLNRQITLQKQELERVNGMKDRLFSTISHDLRTPLSSLYSFSRLLSEGNMDPVKLPRYTAQLQGQLNATLGMMDNLLQWSRTQIKGFHPVIVDLDLAQAADEVFEFIGHEARQKGVRLIQDVTPATIARADRQMLLLILRNLVHNALKYTVRDGQIRLSVRKGGTFAALIISDTGVGIPSYEVAAFNNHDSEPIVSRPGTSGEKGTGLGLTLCQSLATAMGTELRLESEQGKGTAFSLRLSVP